MSYLPEHNGRRTRMGAWIETIELEMMIICYHVAPVWVRGLKPCWMQGHGITKRRTRMGAWIET